MELTIKEIDILIDALDAWESRNVAENLFADLLTHIVIPEGQERDDAKRKLRDDREKEELQKKNEKEKSILIKAKLIQMKDKIVSIEASNYLRNPPEDSLHP